MSPERAIHAPTKFSAQIALKEGVRQSRVDRRFSRHSDVSAASAAARGDRERARADGRRVE